MRTLRSGPPHPLWRRCFCWWTASRREQTVTDLEADVHPELLRIAVVNLLSNAIRHSATRSTVALSVAPAQGALTVAVTDRGPGIAAAEAEHVFEPWYRGQDASDGLGLGLWIVRRIVEWHGSRVMLDSTPSGGSTFSIVLPEGSGDRLSDERPFQADWVPRSSKAWAVVPPMQASTPSTIRGHRLRTLRAGHGQQHWMHMHV